MSKRVWWAIAVATALLPVAAEALEISSPDQIAAGEAIYASKCGSCHGEGLTGGMGPALTGQGFDDHWRGKSARALYGRILSAMPLNEPGSLSDAQAISVTSFILIRNGLEPGSTAASADGLTKTIIP